MGDLPADPRRHSSPRRKGGMTGGKIDPRDQAQGNAAGRPDARETLPDAIVGGPRPAIIPYDARTSEPGQISAIARLIASVGSSGTQASQSDATEWGSVPDPGAIARKLIDDKAAGPGPVPGQGSQHPPDGSVHGLVPGYPALARLTEAGSPVGHGAPNEADIQPSAHVSEAKGPGSRPDPLGHAISNPASHATNPSGSGLPVADGRIALAGAAGRPISTELVPDRAAIPDRGMRPLEPTETTRPSAPANVDGILDAWTSRNGLMPSGSLPAPPSWARHVDAGQSPENDRARARPTHPVAEPDHLAGPSGASRREILVGFHQAAVGTHDHGPQNAPWSGGPAVWGGPTPSDHPAMTGRSAGGATQPDLSRTNDLLQQILDEMRKDQKGFLPVTDRNYNKYLEY